MDTQAYRVAVMLTVNDQLSRQMAIISKDANQLYLRFNKINDQLKNITNSANNAASAIARMNKAMNSNGISSTTRDANNFATAMKKAADSAQVISRASAVAPAALPLAVMASSGAMALASGGGRGGLPPGSAPLLLSGPGGGRSSGGFSAFNGWRNGVPPGGWGGGIPPGGSGNGYGSGNGSHADGIANMAIAYGGLSFMKSAVEAGAEYQTLLARFAGYGMGDAAVKEADKFARATEIIGSSKTDMLRYFTEAQGVFRESGAHTLDEQLKGARMAAPMLAKMHFAMSSMDPAANHMSQAKEMDMLRFVEQAGGLNSPAKFNSIMNNAYKAVQASGGNIDFSQLRQFMSRAGTSAYNLSDIALYAKLEPIIGEMKGGAAGDALMTAYNRLTGTIKLPNQVVKQLEDMGVWDSRKINHNKMGGIKSIIGGPGAQFPGLQLLANDPIQFYEKIIRPKYAAKGMSEEQIQLQNNIIFGRQGGKMFNLVEKQMHVIDLATQAFEKQMGIDDASKQTAGTYNGKVVDFEAKWKNFQLALAQDGGLLDNFTKGLQGLTTFLQKLTEFSNNNPKFMKSATTLLEFVTAMAALKGGVWLAKHALTALISPVSFLSGGSGVPLLTSSLGGLAGVVTRLVPLLALITPTNNTPNTSEELKSRDQWASKNWSKNNPLMPHAPSWQVQVMDWMDKHPGQSIPNFKTDSSGFMSPEIRNPLKTINVHSELYLDGRKVGDALTKHIVKQGSKPPTGVSGVDSTMNLIYPGMGSFVTR
ncbi:TPA: hypothetical protein ACYU77_002934 [Klebsiella variicola subsp. variicola]